MPLQPNIIILNGKYRILRLIGAGGMARVWLAEEVHFGRQVAIKEPHAGLDSADSEELRQRFRREVKVGAALARAKTPNIVQALTAEPYGDSLLLVMDYMPGGDLEERIRQHQQGMPIADVIAIARDVLTALAAVHEHPLDIVHRDIKPSNILFDEEGRARLGDFGLAQVAGWSKGRSDLIGQPHPGTVLYSAPEQATQTGYLQPAADIYALGATLFEALTGKRYKRVISARVSDFRQDVPPWLDELIARAVAENPRDRWQDGGAMLAALKEGVEAERRAQVGAEKHQVAGSKVASDAVGWSQVAGDAGDGSREVGETDGGSGRGKTDGGGSKKGLWAVLAGVAALVLIGLFFTLGGRGGEQNATPVPLANATSTPQTSAENEKTPPPPTATPLPPTATSIPPTNTPIPTPTLSIGSTMVSEKDGVEMVYVPAGEFLMGSTPSQMEQVVAGCIAVGFDEKQCRGPWFNDETPQHPVFLDAFWIDKTEVTNAMYQKCVAMGVCSPPKDYGPKFDAPNHPVVGVSWHDANTYCRWVDRRLPTEAEWEKAARGVDGRIFPWGDVWDVDKTQRLNFADRNASVHGDITWADMNADDGYAETAPAGSYPLGQSPYQALDMAGNAWEWVNDWYRPDYYNQGIYMNPQGPADGVERVFRGGSWGNYREVERTADRGFASPDFQDYVIGFRCAQSSDEDKGSLDTLIEKIPWHFINLEPYSPVGHPEDENTLLGLSPGIYTISGIPFELGWTASTQCSSPGLHEASEELTIPVEVDNAQNVYLLIQAGNATPYTGEEIGQIVLQFSDGSQQKTTLVVGTNIRDWSSSSGQTLSSPYIIGAYEGSNPDKTIRGHMDVLDIPVSQPEKKLASIRILDVTRATVGSIDPCLHVPAITVKKRSSTSTKSPVSTTINTQRLAPTKAPFNTPISEPDAVVNTEGLRLRSGPGTAYAIDASYPKGTKMEVIGKNPKGDWLQVKAPDGKTGWMAASLLTVNKLLGKITVAEIPPTPTAKAPSFIFTVDSIHDYFGQRSISSGSHLIAIGDISDYQSPYLMFESEQLYNGRKFWQTKLTHSGAEFEVCIPNNINGILSVGNGKNDAAPDFVNQFVCQ